MIIACFSSGLSFIFYYYSDKTRTTREIYFSLEIANTYLSIQEPMMLCIHKHSGISFYSLDKVQKKRKIFFFCDVAVCFDGTICSFRDVFAHSQSVMYNLCWLFKFSPNKFWSKNIYRRWRNSMKNWIGSDFMKLLWLKLEYSDIENLWNYWTFFYKYEKVC